MDSSQMTVTALIEALQKLPPDMPVWASSGGTTGLCPTLPLPIRKVAVATISDEPEDSSDHPEEYCYKMKADPNGDCVVLFTY